MFEPLTKQTLVDNIISTLLNMIAKGELKPGSTLPSERKLAAMLNVSRTSVREALKALSFNGIVEIRPGSGTYLSNEALIENSIFSENAERVFAKYRLAYKQVIEARRILEVAMAARTAERILPEGLSEMEKSLDKMQSLLESKSYEAYTMEDLFFHNLIARNCNNEYLYQAYSQLFPSIVDIAHLGEKVPNRHMPALAQHIEIFHAIKAGNAAEVSKCMEAHIDFYEESMRLYFNSIHPNMNE